MSRFVIAVESRNKKEWAYKVAPTDQAEALQEGERAATIIPLFREFVGQPEEYRLERAIARIRRLLNDPEALRARAEALLAGTAQPLLAFAFVALTAFRMVAGPPTPNYLSTVRSHRRQSVAVAIAGSFASVTVPTFTREVA